jgi:acyl-CoA reductase-like NAD-dependent aldehyde dehydrogenase
MGCAPKIPDRRRCRSLTTEILTMSKKRQAETPTATAADIERAIQALNKMAERLWGDDREAEAKALLDALDALNRALDRIRIGESRKTLH